MGGERARRSSCKPAPRARPAALRRARPMCTKLWPTADRVQAALRGKSLSACFAQLRKVSVAESKCGPVYAHLRGSRVGPRCFSGFHKSSSSRTGAAEAAAPRSQAPGAAVSVSIAQPRSQASGPAGSVSIAQPRSLSPSPAVIQARRAPAPLPHARRGPVAECEPGEVPSSAPSQAGAFARPRRTGPSQPGYPPGSEPALRRTGRGQLRHGGARDAGRAGTQS